MTARAKSWKEALHASLTESKLPVKALADVLGVTKQAVYAWADVEVINAYPSGERLPAIVQACSNTAALDYLESLVGRVGCDVPLVGRPALSPAIEALRAFTKLLEASADSLGGTVTLEDAGRVRLLADEAIRAAQGIALRADHCAKLPRFGKVGAA